ncbi:MAG: YcxB family protein [Lachnospiraceae bacterium]|nr:YcxB family protein [Lachnospiraceae bacterium]
MKERIRIKIKTSIKDLYSFMLYHTYTSFNGLFGLACGILCLIMGIAFAERLKSWFLIADVIGVWYTIGTPVILYMKAVKQAKNSMVFHNDIIYFMDNDGFTVRVAQESARSLWSEVTRVAHVGNRIFIYMGRKNAHILPIDQLDAQTDEVVELIKASVPQNKLKGKIFKDGKDNK